MTTIKVPFDGHLKEVELLPCPFCGGAPKCDGLPRGVIGKIYCADENCFGPRTTAMAKADSVEQWNKRPATPIDPDHRAECDRYMKDGSVRRAFVTIIQPGKIPDGKGPFLTVEHLDRFVREAIEHHPDPATHIVTHQLTWDGQLWTECARERAAIDAALDGVDLEQLDRDDEEEGES